MVMFFIRWSMKLLHLFNCALWLTEKVKSCGVNSKLCVKQNLYDMLSIYTFDGYLNGCSHIHLKFSWEGQTKIPCLEWWHWSINILEKHLPMCIKNFLQLGVVGCYSPTYKLNYVMTLHRLFGARFIWLQMGKDVSGDDVVCIRVLAWRVYG